MFERTHDTTPDDPLNWLAVQYVLGELTPSEALAFEERLAVDSLACAAVSEATRLMLTLQSVVVEDASSLNSVPAAAVVCSSASSRDSWFALAGAATAAAGLLAAVALGPADSRSTMLVHNDRSASELVSLWRHGTAVGGVFADESDVEVDESNRELAVPAWLFTAVSIEQSQPASAAFDEKQEN